MDKWYTINGTFADKDKFVKQQFQELMKQWEFYKWNSDSYSTQYHSIDVMIHSYLCVVHDKQGNYEKHYYYFAMPVQTWGTLFDTTSYQVNKNLMNGICHRVINGKFDKAYTLPIVTIPWHNCIDKKFFDIGTVTLSVTHKVGRSKKDWFMRDSQNNCISRPAKDTRPFHLTNPFDYLCRLYNDREKSRTEKGKYASSYFFFMPEYEADEYGKPYPRFCHSNLYPKTLILINEGCKEQFIFTFDNYPYITRKGDK